jgi:hypothetical protein
MQQANNQLNDVLVVVRGWQQRQLGLHGSIEPDKF